MHIPSKNVELLRDVPDLGGVVLMELLQHVGRL
jgi:hypothetical protein